MGVMWGVFLGTGTRQDLRGQASLLGNTKFTAGQMSSSQFEFEANQANQRWVWWVRVNKVDKVGKVGKVGKVDKCFLGVSVVLECAWLVFPLLTSAYNANFCVFDKESIFFSIFAWRYVVFC